jgi:TonB family protein
MRKSSCLFFQAVTLAGTLFCLAATLSAQQTDPFYTNLLEKAEKSFLAKNYAEAARDFQIASFGLAGNKILMAKAYVYLSLSQYNLKDVKASEKSMQEAAAIMGEEGFSKLGIHESARPAFEKLLAFFSIPQPQSEPLSGAVADPKQETEAKAVPASPENKPVEKAVEPPGSPTNPPPAKNADIKLDDIKEGDIVLLELADTPPVAVRRVPAIYPNYVGARTVEGTVTVNALVSENGSVVKTEIGRSMKKYYGFDQAALRAVQQWKFEPAMINGIRVKVWLPVAIEFKKRSQ